MFRCASEAETGIRSRLRGKARSLVSGDDSRVWHASSGPEPVYLGRTRRPMEFIASKAAGRARWIVVDILSALNNAFSRCVF